MKKRMFAIACIMSAMILGNTIPAFAYQPKIIGQVLSTDIRAHIDEQPIRSYNYQDRTYVMAEDLCNYGFQVDWDSTARTLNITLPAERTAKKLSHEEKNAIQEKHTPGKKLFDVYQTDIQVLFDGKPIPDENNVKTSINVNGNTLILLSSLQYFGEVTWDPDTPFNRSSFFYTTGKICTTDFGFQYQEMERIPWNYYCFHTGEGQSVYNQPVSNNPAYDLTYEFLDKIRLGVFGDVCLSKGDKYVYYAKVEQELLDMLQLKFTQIDDNKLRLESTLDSDFIGIRNAGVFVMQEPHSVYKINFSLYKDGKILEMPDFPTFLSIQEELYINFDILAEALDWEAYTGDEFGDWNRIYAKGEAKTLSYWEDFFAKEKATEEIKEEANIQDK